jgi:hypothetical protein
MKSLTFGLVVRGSKRAWPNSAGAHTEAGFRARPMNFFSEERRKQARSAMAHWRSSSILKMAD